MGEKICNLLISHGRVTVGLTILYLHNARRHLDDPFYPLPLTLNLLISQISFFFVFAQNVKKNFYNFAWKIRIIRSEIAIFEIERVVNPFHRSLNIRAVVVMRSKVIC